MLAATWLLSAVPTPPAAAEGTTPVAAVEIHPRDLSREVAVSARVEPYRLLRLAARTGGTLERIDADVGDAVAAGDVLARIDVAEAAAELRRAEARVREARLEYERAVGLRERQVISSAEYERAAIALEVARSDRDLWRTRVAYGEVTAPMGGVITARHVEPGEAVDARETLFELASMDRLVLRPRVSELDVIHLSRGQPVPIRFDAFPDLAFDGTIQRIFPAAEPDSPQFRVEIALPGDTAGRGVRPGNLGRARITVDPRPDALAVPTAAVGEDDDGAYVYVIADERLQRRAVERGVTRGPWTEIVDGLAAGEIALATNPIDMADGQRVRIVGWRG